MNEKNLVHMEDPMKERNPGSTAAEPKEKMPGLSLDWWTVVVGLALAALVLAGLPAIPW
jgi:hypothetical protein